VGQGHRQENASVRTQDPSMEGDRAKDLRNRPECAMLEIAPWMATGRSGENGGNVPGLVAADSTHAPELAPILLLGTAGKIALGNPKKPVPVTPSPVQWMAIGRSGQNGGNVPGLVAVDSTLALEPARIPHRGTAEKIALGNPMKLVLVILSLVQSMASGVVGLCGQPVQSHVVKANKREAVPAQIPHQPMEVNNVLVKLNRRRIVTLSLAQGALKSLTLPSW